MHAFIGPLLMRIFELQVLPFRLSPRPSHAGYDPKRTWGTLKFIIANDKSLKKIALRQPIAVVA